MPNWSQGVLKIKGKQKDIQKFLITEIERWGFPYNSEDGNYTKYPLNEKIEEEYESLYICKTDDEYNSWLYFKDSRRCFVEEDIDIYFEGDNSENEIIVLDIKQAWRIEPDYFIEQSKKYNIDFKGMFFECGMCFTQELEIIKGEQKIYKETEYKETEYNWEVYDPRLGG